MSFLAGPGNAPTIPYAGRSLEVLAGLDGRPEGFAVAVLGVPPHFPGPPAHAHDLFDEGFYVLEGRLLVQGDGEPLELGAGSLFTVPRGERHAFSNPGDVPARLLGIWGPARPALDLLTAVGAALPADRPADPETMRAIYEAHSGRVFP